MIDARLLERWERVGAARRQARSAIPPGWWRDPRPEMQDVIDAFVETVARRADEPPRSPHSAA
jgi:hypothetical protein